MAAVIKPPVNLLELNLCQRFLALSRSAVQICQRSWPPTPATPTKKGTDKPADAPERASPPIIPLAIAVKGHWGRSPNVNEVDFKPKKNQRRNIKK